MSRVISIVCAVVLGLGLFSPAPVGAAETAAAQEPSAPTSPEPTEPGPTEPEPTTPEPEPTEPTTPEPTTPDPTATTTPAPTASAETAEPLVPTALTLTRAAGTTMPQEAATGTVAATADGEPLADATVNVLALDSYDTTKEVARVEVVTAADGTGRYDLTLPAGRYYLRAVLEATESRAASQSDDAYVAVQAGSWVSLLVNNGFGSKVMTRENFWLRGRVLTTWGEPQSGVAVTLYRYSGSSRTKVATVKTNASGWYTWSPHDRRAGTYRAVVSQYRYSALQAVSISIGRRDLLSREASLQFLLGARQTATRTGGGRSWRYYTEAVLIDDGSRTWVVRRPATGELSGLGGAGGSLGAPTGDIRCGLPESGCLQQFRYGAIYVNASAKDTVTSALASTLGAGDLLAVARSQVGYQESSPRQSKYNRWIGQTGSDDPWCGFLMSWLAYAAGKPNAVIKASSFKSLLSAERKRGRTSSTPRIGRLAYIGYFTPSAATHVGIVTKYDDSYVWTVEGNVSAGGGTAHPRGVHVVKRPKSRVVFYADPLY